jgi:hypothetical protein
LPLLLLSLQLLPLLTACALDHSLSAAPLAETIEVGLLSKNGVADVSRRLADGEFSTGDPSTVLRP